MGKLLLIMGICQLKIDIHKGRQTNEGGRDGKLQHKMKFVGPLWVKV